MTPVDTARITHGFATAAKRLRELAVRLERLRPCKQLLVQRDEFLRARSI